MAQVVNTNILSLNAQRNLNSSQGALATSLERLSSGLRINSAKDDAAGLAISERFTTQIRGLNQAVRNANDGISFAQTAEGALSTVGDALQRIRELAVQSANDTNSASDRQALNNEVQQLIAEVNRVANATDFNGQKILDGSLSEMVFQVGANQNQTIAVTGVDSRGSQLGAALAEGATFASSELTFPLTDVQIQGITVDLKKAESVNDVVAAINNRFADTGVQASRATTTQTAALTYTPGTTASSINLNGVEIATLSDDDNAALVDRINNFSTQTGVTAAVDGTGIVLSNRSGADIELKGAPLGGPQTFTAGIVVLSAKVGTEINVRWDGRGFSSLASRVLVVQTPCRTP
jgi:flagellin